MKKYQVNEGEQLELLSEGMEVRTAAELIGFKGHRKMGKYMNVRGYIWDGDQNNYVR